jgi:hypothetical protein
MNPIILFRDNDIQDLLKEIHVDQENIQSILAHAKIIGVKDSVQQNTATLDAIQRLLKHPEVVVAIRTPNQGTQVWDFESEKIMAILEKHWPIFRDFPVNPDALDFMLHSRDAIPNFGRYLPKPITILKEPPPEFA